MNNLINTWVQGHFIDGHRYSDWTIEEKLKAEAQERLLVRPSPFGNYICQCSTPDAAEWIAKRLNLAADLERQLLVISASLFKSENQKYENYDSWLSELEALACLDEIELHLDKYNYSTYFMRGNLPKDVIQDIKALDLEEKE